MAEHQEAEDSAVHVRAARRPGQRAGVRRLPAAAARRLRDDGADRPARTSTTRPSPPSTTPRSSGSPRSTPTSTTGARTAPAPSTPPPPTRTAPRLEQAGEWGGLLIAHHYTRYLGDLSGGQAIGRILDRTFELDGKGIAFYDFPEIEKPKIYKDGYRARLDALGMSAEEQDRVVDEVKVAFRLNQALFVELGKNLESYAADR